MRATSSRSPARQTLEAAVARDPGAGAAYVELARIAMKANWGAEGLHQADTLLQSALNIDPADVDARILMGYVETHQRRFKEAQALFSEIAKSAPPNAWLWTNWGEMLAMQGHTSEAIEKYREAIRRPRTNASTDGARVDAYQRLIVLLDARGDTAGMEALYQQEASEYGISRPCATAAYAKFELPRKGNPAAAIAIAKPAAAGLCSDADSPRDILGMALYAAWDNDPDSPAGKQSLNQARVYLPAGMRVFSPLAADDRTLPSARRLVRMNEPVDARDNEGWTALARAGGPRPGDGAAPARARREGRCRGRARAAARRLRAGARRRCGRRQPAAARRHRLRDAAVQGRHCHRRGPAHRRDRSAEDTRPEAERGLKTSKAAAIAHYPWRGASLPRGRRRTLTRRGVQTKSRTR